MNYCAKRVDIPEAEKDFQAGIKPAGGSKLHVDGVALLGLSLSLSLSLGERDADLHRRGPLAKRPLQMGCNHWRQMPGTNDLSYWRCRIWMPHLTLHVG
jgi:hypothetical protein